MVNVLMSKQACAYNQETTSGEPLHPSCVSRSVSLRPCAYPRDHRLGSVRPLGLSTCPSDVLLFVLFLSTIPARIPVCCGLWEV